MMNRLSLYQAAITLTHAVMTGHRAGHLEPHVLKARWPVMTAPVSRVTLSAGWYYTPSPGPGRRKSMRLVSVHIRDSTAARAT